jgi:outer membrane protein OmpA-like peptidoglycan-associated protein
MDTLNKTEILVCALALSACATTPKADADAAVVTEAPMVEAVSPAPAAETPSAATEATSDTKDKGFPDPDKTYVKAVQRYDAAQIKKVDIGLNKNQVRFLLGNPHFSEGIFVVKSWNYLVGLQKPNSNEYQVCQLRIDFDKDRLVESLNWRDSACEALLDEPKPNLVAKSVPLKTYTSNSILFNFNRSSANDIVGGAVVVDKLISEIRSNFADVEQVSVIGYADRIGKSDSNAVLSQARAKTIADLLISQGISAEAVHSGGQGSTNAFVSCTGTGKNHQVIQCLEPNRRVVVSVTGQ